MQLVFAALLAKLANSSQLVFYPIALSEDLKYIGVKHGRKSKQRTGDGAQVSTLIIPNV